MIAVILLLALCGSSAEAATLEDSVNIDGGTQVSARVWFRGANGRFLGVRMEILRNEQRVLMQRPGKLCRSCEAEPLNFAPQDDPVRIVQLDGSPEPEVIFNFWAGGAHCCVYSYIFRYIPERKAYLGLKHDFRDAGYRLGDPNRDRQLDFISSDVRSAYLFGCFACSHFPPQIWQYSAGRFVDVTRDFPRQVRRSLRPLVRHYRRMRGRGDVRTLVAAIVADFALLGKQRRGLRLLRSALSHGYLRAEGKDDVWPAGARYSHRLRRFLQRTGYL